MSDEEALGGAGEAHVEAVAECIQVLEHQLAMLTQMVQPGVKPETIVVRNVVGQFAQRVPHITPEKVEIYVVESTCFMCRKAGHIAKDCMKQREPPTCNRCNAVGRVAAKCRVRDVYIQIFKNK